METVPLKYPLILLFIILSRFAAGAQEITLGTNHVNIGVAPSLSGLGLKNNLRNRLAGTSVRLFSVPAIQLGMARDFGPYLSLGPMVNWEFIGLNQSSSGRRLALHMLNLGLRINWFINSGQKKTRYFFAFRPGYQWYVISTTSLNRGQNAGINLLNTVTGQLGTGMQIKIAQSLALNLELMIGRPSFIAFSLIKRFGGSVRENPGIPSSKKKNTTF